ncbi:MAG: hypothetical protein EBS29_09010 [Chloroflexia bacterium]|nr:hypothetical protein [Chloroflexia bacterium]
MILFNCLSAFAEEQVDHVERRLAAADLRMPVLIKPCATDQNSATLAGWRQDIGPVCHVIPLELLSNPTRRGELDTEISRFIQLLRTT